SHDIYFINKLADRFLYLTPNGVISYVGGYDGFKAKKDAPREAEVKKETAAALDYKEQKRLESERRKTINRFNKVEEEISQKESEIETLTHELENPEIATDYVKAGEITEKITALQAEVDALMEEWEELQIIIEERGYEI
ncbi:MAG: ABC transporter ATP-binding protein, partial [Clostridia bacterium]|nr:ABC transporter ATP-binding protein [Clostridia bacterium]